jgi:PAS domain S-box-containing protein
LPEIIKRDPTRGLAERLRNELRFETLLADLSASFVGLPADRIDGKIENAQRRICDCLGLDHSAVWQSSQIEPGTLLLTHLYRDANLPPPPSRMDGDTFFPWTQRKIKMRETVCLASIMDAPAEAATDKQTWQAYGIKSTLAFPLWVGDGPVFGVISFAATRQEREYPEALLKRLQLLAQVFANALARKRIEQALSESEARLRLAAAAANAGLWTLEPASGRIWATAETKGLYGLGPTEEFDLPRFLRLVHPDHLEAVKNIIAETIQSGEDKSAEYRIIRTDGEVRWICSRGRRCVNLLNEPQLLMGISLDVTDEKQLDEARLKHSAIIESSNDAIISINRRGIISDWNSAAELIYGYTEEEAVGQNIDLVTPPELRGQEARMPTRIEAGEPSEHYETTHVTKGGNKIAVSLTISPVRDSTGNIVGFSKIVRDITDRKRTERRLLESEERFRLVANSAPVLIWMSGTDKLCNFFNQGWLSFTGRSMAEELGEGWASGVHPDDLENCLKIYSASFDARVDFEMEYRLRRFDGEYRWIVDFGVPRFESDGTFCGYIGSCVDITERKSSAESLQNLTGRLIHAQEEERSRIARELHDDFSQSLALQCNDLEQLQKRLPELEVGERARVMKMLKRGKAMCADIRSLSHKLHSSKLEFVGLAPAVSGLCEEISEQYKIEVNFTERGTPRNIPKDVALCLFRVTQEALANVVKHSQAKKAHVELTTNGNGVSLRITDEGMGFDPERVHPGAGIGLVGMTERLRLVSGRLSIRSELKRGTELLAEVPLSAPANEGPARTLAAGGTES